MLEREKLAAGVDLTVWGYTFLLFNVDINGFSLIPGFVGYLLLFLATRRLGLNRLGMPCLLLLGYDLLKWLGYLAAFDGNFWLFLTIFLFNFFWQAYFLAALVELAASHLPGRSVIAELTGCRKWYLGCMGVAILLYLAGMAGMAPALLLIGWALVSIGVGIWLLAVLFRLRRILGEPDKQAAELG